MVVRSGSLKVRGLRDFSAALKPLADRKSFEDQLATANQYVGELVVDRAEPRMRGLGGMGARAAMTLEARRSKVSARVSLGGPSAPFAPGVEFGAIRNVPRRTRRGPVRGWNQFRPWRGNGMDAGYALFPTIRESGPEFIEIYDREVGEIFSRAFPD